MSLEQATVLIPAMEAGETAAAEELLELVYGELRRLAASKMAAEAPGHTLQPTALVHEAWLRLATSRGPPFENRAHFFAAAAEAMRRILIDRARRKLAHRRGARAEHVPLDECEIAAPDGEERLLAVNEALDKLAAEYPVQANLVKLRYFGGLTNKEAAEVLGVSLTTVKKYWTFARTWLFQEIKRA